MSVKITTKIKPKTNVDLIPMIDIVFQLVIFFMVATTFKTTTGMELEYPKAEYVNQISTAPLNIVVKNQNSIMIGDKINTNIAQFRKILQQVTSSNQNDNKSVVLYGDKNINYQLLIDVMNDLRLEGYESIDLAIKKKINND